MVCEYTRAYTPDKLREQIDELAKAGFKPFSVTVEADSSDGFFIYIAWLFKED